MSQVGTAARSDTGAKVLHWIVRQGEHRPVENIGDEVANAERVTVGSSFRLLSHGHAPCVEHPAAAQTDFSVTTSSDNPLGVPFFGHG